jgi:hypothetical protein
MARTAVRVAVATAALLALAFSGCSGSDTGASKDGHRYLVLPEDTPGLVVAVDDATGDYASGVVRPDLTARVANVHPMVIGSFEALTDGRASATLPNGLEVFYVCGGRATSGGLGGSPTTETVAGPLMVLAQVDGGFLDVTDTPTDTGACTQPTAATGPLVDMAASLRWVDEAEFRRLVEAYPGPDRATTPAAG